MEKRGIIYAIEILFVILLIAIFFYAMRNTYITNTMPYSNILKEIRIKTLFYSMNLILLNKLLDYNVKEGLGYIYLHSLGEQQINAISIDLIHPVYINYTGSCALLFYPLPEGYKTYFNVISSNRSCKIQYWFDWYKLSYSYLPSNNVTIEIKSNVTIDPNSIYVFSNDIPVNIRYVNISRNNLSLSLVNITPLINVEIYFRNKTYYPVSLPYHLFGYKIVDKSYIANPEAIIGYPKYSNWITLLGINCGYPFVLKISDTPPTTLPIDNTLQDRCIISEENVAYIFSNPKFIDRIYYPVSLEESGRKISIPLLFFPIKIINIYVS